ncbi:MAG: YdeI/OmpD-associated family protein [Spirochaetales bacterium]|nr:YdeI/OmpD-associated family protein [Leptospiraceae bacterium]MCP5480906.1 YdeI/OmpD-associated family protein [Spirochaetales bacterium]MCP5485286.1 YdeI/OmpD-associated family protein [Spirochaetales bacterium]
MSPSNPKVDAFIHRAQKWKREMEALRAVLLTCDLEEQLKWGKPCYTANGRNIVIVQPLKAHLALLFFKGALLEDKRGILKSQGKNTQAARRMEFTDIDQVTKVESILKQYIKRAIELEELGRKLPRQQSPQAVPAEFQSRLQNDPAYRQAFEALTPGRKRSYLIHFSGAKQSKTREDRIVRCRAKILEGKGYNER